MNTPACVAHLDDIQAHLIRGAKPAAARYYFLGIRDVAAFLAFMQQPLLQSLLLSEQDVRSLQKGFRPRPAHPCFANVAFSYRGLQALGLAGGLLDQFPPAFSEGMAARAKFIGDEGNDAPDNWEGYYGSQQIHVMIAVYFLPWLEPGFTVPHEWPAPEIQRHDELLQQLWQQLTTMPTGADVLMQESAHVIREARQIKEHFGFADGVSQPYIDDGLQHRGGGGKKIRNDSPWSPLAPGEFLLGYRDELYERNHPDCSPAEQWEPDLADPAPAAFQRLTRNGSFLVYRKLEQDVVAFRRLVQQGPADLGAKLVGRHHDGTPLTPSAGAARDNEFDYTDDRTGDTCPFASHMRRVNPRLSLSQGNDEGTLRVDQHRLIRRGMPYGPYIPLNSDVASAPEARRGLHFFCYNSRIDSQFEFVQKNWINQCDFLGFPTSMVDPIVGNRSGDQAGQYSFNRSALPLFGLQQYVHVRGGEYFFTPGIQGLRLLLGMAQHTNPFWRPKQHIQTFDPRNSDPFAVADYVDAARLIAGNRFVKLWVEKAGGQRTPFYYFAHPADMVSILNQLNLFTNVQYRQRIEALTGGEMLLSRDATPQRAELKKQTWNLLSPQHFEQRMQAAVQPMLAAIRSEFANNKQLDLVEGLARKLPLAVMKNLYGMDAPALPADGIYSRSQIAHFFDRTDFATLPDDWKQHYADYGFRTSADDTLLFWVRMLFLQVFGNVYGVEYIGELAHKAADEFLPLLDAQIRKSISGAAAGDTVLDQLIVLFQQEYHLAGDDLVKAVRQSVLELAVGSTDTTAKGIAMVVKTLLEWGKDLPTALLRLLQVADKAQAIPLLQQWLQQPQQRLALEPQINALLEQVAVLCLYQNPVAPLLPRYCLNGATYTTSVGEILDIEAGAVVCLVPQVTLAVELNDLLFGNTSPLRETFPFTNGRFLFMGDTTHACMGRQIALFEIREALKLLLSLPAVRPAAGAQGQMVDKYRLPASMLLRCD
ncbi:MAG: Dyp-type peroxidase [Gammaproteobacteria bacterium]